MSPPDASAASLHPQIGDFLRGLRSGVGRLAFAGLILNRPSHVGAQAIPPTGRLIEELRIDGSERTLSSASTLTVSSKGTMVVAQEGGVLRFFREEGTEERRYGRMGEGGPGEFIEAPIRFGWLGERPWALEVSGMRATLLDETHLRSEITHFPLGLKRPSGERIPRMGMGLGLVNFAPDRDFIVSVTITQPQPPNPFWGRLLGADRTALVLVDRQGVFKRVLAKLQTSGQRCATMVDRTSFLMLNDLCSYALWRIDGSGRIFILDNLQPTGGATVTHRVTAISPTGDTIYSKNFVEAAHTLSRTRLDSLRAVLTQRYSPRAKLPNAPALAKTAQTIRLPSIPPAVTDAFSGNDGTFWIKTNALLAPPGRSVWTGLDEQGSPFVTLTFPQRVTPRAATKTSIWVSELDDDDVPSIVRYRIGIP